VTAPRIALLGFSIECNRFAPVATEADFAGRTLIRGEAMVMDARSAAPHMLGELPGFIADMDAAGAWEPVPILLAMAEPNGPVEQAFFDRMMSEWEHGLRNAGKLDGVYCVLHGAGLTTADHDPEGTLLTLVRGIVGPDLPVVASYDLHANVSDANVDLVNAYIGYRTNPHLDMRERGAESAQVLRRLLSGTRTHLAHVRLPIVPPTVSMLTGKDAHQRPYGEMIDLGQQRMHEAPYAGRVLNVSVMGGFAYADTPFNGLTVVVTATDRDAAEALAWEIAEAGWERRERFRAELTSLDDAVELAKGTEDRGRPALVFADVADNPGGGGRGNTMWIIEAFHRAGVKDALVGVIHDPALAAEAHRLGQGERFTARFNRDGGDEFSKPFSAPAVVRRLHDGNMRGRRGIYANNTLALGPCAALQLDGITVVVISNRVQCADPVFFEAFGLDIGAARVVVVKSRGHFRGGFDEFFRHEQVVEVDAPGLTSPVLSRFPWKHMPRPVLPIDATAQFPRRPSGRRGLG
jgi:microcystin degradation protein MlrC